MDTDKVTGALAKDIPKVKWR